MNKLDKQNLKPREELRKLFCDHYLTLSEDKNGVLIFYYGNSDTVPIPEDINLEVRNPIRFTIMTHYIGSNLSENQFYESLNVIESKTDFICYVGEKHQFVFEYYEKLNSENCK